MSGIIFVISAPSGTGKTTILKELMNQMPNLAFSISHTTRAPRTGEQNGVDYYFVSKEEFINLEKKGDFLEWAEVHGNYYGTSLSGINRQLTEGMDVFLDIDVQGARQVREKNNDKCTIFIIPPSWEEQEKRLTGRNTDSNDIIKTRLANARLEIADEAAYDYLIVNDRLTEAVESLKSIIIAERCRRRRHLNGTKCQLPSISDKSA